MTTTAQKTLLDGSLLDATAALLSANGVPFTRTDEALRCELSVAGQAYAVVYLVPAQGVFPDDWDGNAFATHFGDIQESLLGTDFYARPRKDLYLLVVGDAEFLTRPASSRAAADIEQDLSYGKKEVFTPVQALDWLRGPFWTLTGDMRANPAPSVATVADFGKEGQPAPTRILDVEDILSNSEEPRHIAKLVAEAVYRKVMGSDRKVFWPDNQPELGRIGDEDGLPVTFCSSGERIAFAFSLFLARAMMEVEPGMCLGFRGSFDRLDAVRQIGAYDCLREFAAATGAGIVVQSAKTSLRELVQRRVSPVIEACGGKVTDYPQKY
jgi:hypothetical protein